jgi:hypothetical protein
MPAAAAPTLPASSHLLARPTRTVSPPPADGDDPPDSLGASRPPPGHRKNPPHPAAHASKLAPKAAGNRRNTRVFRAA